MISIDSSQKPELTYVSSGALDVRDAKEAIERCQSAGITNLELASGLKCPPEQWPLVEAAATNMSFLLHNYFPAPDDPFVLNLASGDPALLARSLAFCRQAINFSQTLNAPFYSMHAGFVVELNPQDLGNPDALRHRTTEIPGDRLSAMALFRQSVICLADYAENRGVRLLLENNVVAHGSFQPGMDHGLLMVDAEEVTEFFETIKHENIGLLVDVGHAKVSARTLGFDLDDWLAAVLPYTEAFHLSDNDGYTDSNKPFKQDAWFMSQLRQLDDVPRVVEVYNIDDQPIRELVALAAHPIAI